MDVGEKIRKMRKEKKLTIRDIAEQAEVTSSMISQIERNMCNPSLSLLRKISQILGIPVWALLYEEDAQTCLIRKGDRKIIAIGESGAMKQAYLTPPRKQFDGKEHQLEIIYDEWEPGIESGFFQHRGEEAVFILSGQLEASVSDEVHNLDEGDCLFYYAETPHSLKAIGDEAVKFLTIITPPDF